MTFEQYLTSVGHRLDEELRAIVYLAAGVPERLREAMAYALFTGGKRLRPAMLVFTNQMFKEKQAAYLAACAVEMVHTYSLVHDDLPAMDDDDLRRGKPSCHKAFDEATAILAGDALLTLAFEVMSSLQDHGVPPLVACLATRELARAAGWRGMVAGQALDMELTRQATAEQVQRMHDLKTGCMFVASLRLGGLIGECTDEDIEALSQFGRHFGRLYQAVDDLEDMGAHSSDLERSSLAHSVGVQATRDYIQREACFARQSLLRFKDKAWWLAQLIDSVTAKVITG